MNLYFWLNAERLSCYFLLKIELLALHRIDILPEKKRFNVIVVVTDTILFMLSPAPNKEAMLIAIAKPLL